ncbi:unnamed protein product [Ilex paraguariensis]|uniref:Uncharacterized protein n=1 Tax=Ilex paraguariensis TaxID=185542 RepID=A0ABC8RMK8_9AQUA
MPKSPLQLSAFGSANTGTVSLPTTLFATGVEDGILAKAFKTDVATIQKLKIVRLLTVKSIHVHAHQQKKSTALLAYGVIDNPRD